MFPCQSWEQYILERKRVSLSIYFKYYYSTLMAYFTKDEMKIITIMSNNAILSIGWLCLDQNNKDESRLKGYQNAIQHFWTLFWPGRLTQDIQNVNERSKSALLEHKIKISCLLFMTSRHLIHLWVPCRQ